MVYNKEKEVFILLKNFNDYDFGKRLKHLRSMYSLSQEKLAEGVGCSTQYIYQIESGRCKPSIDTLLALSDIFGVSVDYLLKGNNDSTSDILDSVIKDFTPLQRESLANTIMLIKLDK